MIKNGTKKCENFDLTENATFLRVLRPGLDRWKRADEICNLAGVRSVSADEIFNLLGPIGTRRGLILFKKNRSWILLLLHPQILILLLLFFLLIIIPFFY